MRFNLVVFVCFANFSKISWTATYAASRWSLLLHQGSCNEVIVKGDKVDPECFHFFCEKNTLADFVALICQRTIDRLIKVEAQLTDPLAR